MTEGAPHCANKHKMNSFLFLILFAIGISASYDIEDRLATALNKLLKAEAEAKLKFQLLNGVTEEMTSAVTAAAVAGGLDVVDKVIGILNELPMIKYLSKQTEVVEKLVEDMRKEAAAMQKALGKEYKEYQNKLVAHIEKIEQVGRRLIKLATTAWLRCGVNAQDILDFGYTKRAQKSFTEFLATAIEEAKDIISKLEEVKVGVHQLVEQSKTNQILVKQYFEGEILRLEKAKAENKKLWFICLIPIACPFAAIAITDMKKNIHSQMDYMKKVGDDLVHNFKDAQSNADAVYAVVSNWIPQSQALQTALEHTADIQKNVVEVLEEDYIKNNPEEAGIQNVYLIRLFHAMKGLQTAAENVDGFPMDQMKDLGGIRVPEFPTQHDVCACLYIADLDDWSKSDKCMTGASSAMQTMDDFPWCRLRQSSCKRAIKEYLPKMGCKVAAEENEAFVAKKYAY